MMRDTEVEIGRSGRGDRLRLICQQHSRSAKVRQASTSTEFGHITLDAIDHTDGRNFTSLLLSIASPKIYPARAPRACLPAVSTPHERRGEGAASCIPRSVHRDHLQVPQASMLLAGSAGAGVRLRYPLQGGYGRGLPHGLGMS